MQKEMFRIPLLVVATALGLGACTPTAPAPTSAPTSAPSADPVNPIAPLITGDEHVNGCFRARIWWVDSELNEDGVRYYRRTVGQPVFEVIETRGPHAGQGAVFDDNSQMNLPAGIYEYQVGVFNEVGEAFSNISEPFYIPETVYFNAVCRGPFSPIVTDHQLVYETCAARIWFEDHSEDEDGLRLYRTSGGAWKVVAELGPHAGVPGEFVDPGLAPASYYSYKVSAFNTDGEVFSNTTGLILAGDLDPDACKKGNVTQPSPFQSGNPLGVITPNATVQSTITPSPVVQAQACVWEAAVNVFVRTGPSASLYPVITAVVSGTVLPVVGQSEDGQYWIVELQPSMDGYVPKTERFGAASGDCSGAPTLQDPVPPPTAVPTAKPQCSDGIDNDGDGWIDGLDRQCTGPNDTSE